MATGFLTKDGMGAVLPGSASGNPDRGPPRHSVAGLRNRPVSLNLPAFMVVLLMSLAWALAMPQPARGGTPGTLKWPPFSTGHVIWNQSPALANGIVYITNYQGEIFAVDDATGLMKWSTEMAGYYATSPAIGADGTIYAATTSPETSSIYTKLYAYFPNLVIKDSYEAEYHGDEIDTTPALAPDGTVYFGLDTYTSKLIALTSQFTLKWEWFGEGRGAYKSSPAIGPDGTIYVGRWGLYAVTPAGKMK
jgi:outer membrane protein assembly factor BamB